MRVSPKLLSMRCTNPECKKLHYVKWFLLNRAKQPHCVKCGDTLEEISVSRKRRGMPATIVEPVKREKTNRCAGCGANLGMINHEQMLLGHLKRKLICRKEYRDLGRVNESGIILPSLFAYQMIGKSRWGVRGITVYGGEIHFTNFPDQQSAEEYIEKQKSK